jgi:putative transposase
VLNVLIQDKRDVKAATRFFPHTPLTPASPAACAGHRQTPQLQVAHRTSMSTVEHRQNKYLNN